MKKLLAVLMLSAALVGCAATSVPKITPSVIIENNVGHGSGVYIGNGYFVTANHVMEGAVNDFNIRDINDHVYKGKVLWGNKDYDIALLKVDFNGVSDFATPNLVCRDFEIGEKLWTYGSPLNLEFVRIGGEVVSGKAQSDESWKKYFITDINLLPGNSGGPVFDENENLVGIAVGAFVNQISETDYIPTGYSFVVPSSVICDLMAKSS